MGDIKYMTASEFRDEGYVQELNRRFLHPLGLALEVRTDPTGNVILGGVWDCRDDDEGLRFEFVDFDGNQYLPAKSAEEQKDEFLQKAEHINELWRERKRARVMALKYMVQPYGDHFTEVGSDIVELLGRALGEEMSKVIPVTASSESWNKAARGILDKLCEMFAEEPYNPETVTAEEVHLIDLLLGPEAVTGAHTRAEAVNMVIDRGKAAQELADFYKGVFESASAALARIGSGDFPPGMSPQEFADEALALLAGDLGG